MDKQHKFALEDFYWISMLFGTTIIGAGILFLPV
jgi:amino acid permease